MIAFRQQSEPALTSTIARRAADAPPTLDNPIGVQWNTRLAPLPLSPAKRFLNWQSVLMNCTRPAYTRHCNAQPRSRRRRCIVQYSVTDDALSGYRVCAARVDNAVHLCHAAMGQVTVAEGPVGRPSATGRGCKSLGRLTAPTPPADRRPRAGSATATHTMG